MLLQSLVDWTKDFPESDSLFSCTKIHAATWQFCSFAIRYLPDCLDKTASRRIQCRVRANHHPPNSAWLGRQEAVLLCLVTTILWIYCHCPPKVRLPTKQHIDIANTATAATTLINTLKHAWVVRWIASHSISRWVNNFWRRKTTGCGSAFVTVQRQYNWW